MTLLLVMLGGAVGAPARYLTDRWIQSRHRTRLPWGTWTVNVAGSFLLGALAASQLGDPAMALLGLGLCGALTTYSTFGYETVRLLESGAYAAAFTYAFGSIAAGLAAAFGGGSLALALS